MKNHLFASAKRQNKKNTLIAVTTGDQNGIGYEVAAKALLHMGNKIGNKNYNFILFVSSSAMNENTYQILNFHLKKKFQIISFDSLDEALLFAKNIKLNKKVLIEVQSQESPARWVESAAIAACRSEVAAIVTGPLAKPTIKKIGLKDLGHTEILKRICRVDNAWMGFLGKNFNVFLLSGHVPINKIELGLTSHQIKKALLAAVSAFKPTTKRPLALLGLNPHAGDLGLIGSFENKTLKSVLIWAKKNKIPCIGPLVPDTAFIKNNWNKFSCFICCYHDQGLIPFKLAHGFSGVHMTVGLPIIRTSVDHGTAYDIYGKDIADYTSMRDALIHAIKMVHSNSKVSLTKRGKYVSTSYFS